MMISLYEDLIIDWFTPNKSVLFPKTLFDHTPEAKSNEYSALLKSVHDPSFITVPVPGFRIIFWPTPIATGSFSSIFSRKNIWITIPMSEF